MEQQLGSATGATLKVVVMHFLEDADVLLASALREALERAGCTLIRGDDNFANEQTKIIHFHDRVRKADLLIPLLSTSFCASPELIQEVQGWISFSEISGRPIICPVLVDDIEPSQLNHQIFIRRLRDTLKNPNDFDEFARYIRNTTLLRLAEVEVVAKQQQDRQAKVEARLDEYVNPFISQLRFGQRWFFGASAIFYTVALSTLLLGLRFAWVRANHLAVTSTVSWYPIAGFAAGGIVVIGMLTAVARLAYMLGKSFMVEALRNADRIHAISFGQFYLRLFGDRVEWKEVKEAFQHWNIDKGSSFITQSPSDIEPVVWQSIIDTVRETANKAKETTK